jgi:hypothetical protein
MTKTRKIALGLCIVYFLYYTFGPLIASSYKYSFLTPIVYIVPLLLVFFIVSSSSSSFIRIFSSLYLWTPICLAGMILGIVIGTYMSIGMISVVILASLLLSSNMNPPDKLLLALCIVWAPIGLWELAFNAGLYWIHLGSYTPHNLLIQEIYDFAWMIAGVIAIVYLKLKHLIHFTLLLLATLLIGVSAFTAWIVIGMPTGVVFVNGNGPFYPTTNIWLSGVLVHLSKIIYLAPIAMMRLRK